MRTCSAIITVATGRQGTRQFPVKRVQQYMTSQAIDNDADAFSIDIGDSTGELALCLDRDNEVRVNLFLDDMLGRPQQIFNGIVDQAVRGSDMTLSMEGRDTPSSLAVDSDALPEKKYHVNPKLWIEQHAHALGISNTQIASMSQIKSFLTDGSEKEWSTWYRMARMRGMFMWTGNTGALIVDKLGYSLSPTYKFGQPPRGESSSEWHPIEDDPLTSNKQSRVRKVIVYGIKGGSHKGKKKTLATPMVAQGTDQSISSWRKQPTLVMTSTIAKTQAELQATAKEEVFESIVGTQELTLTIRDTGVLIQQNKMCLVNLPKHGINMEPWYVVGVSRQGGAAGLMQIVRLREKGYAISRRVPDAPTLQNPKDLAQDKPAASISAFLAQNPNLRYADSFVRATNEFGVPNGWDFAVFLGVLLAICSKETGGSFANERESHSGAINHREWQTYQEWLNAPDIIGKQESAASLEILYEQTFANSQHNSFNPFYPGREAGVGLMQLTSPTYKMWADTYGWNDNPASGEYDGGRWNPDSNIRAAARALIEKLKVSPPADPNNSDTIWIGVARYNGSGPDATAYAQAVRQIYKDTFLAAAQGAVASVKSIPPGTAQKVFTIPGHGTITLPSIMPPEAAKAISWAMSRLGDPYEWGGTGPNYDCSSFVTEALATSAAYLRKMLDPPVFGTNNHGDDTYTLWDKGTNVPRDKLRPADLLFFRGDPPEHVGMYITDGLFIHDPKPGDHVKLSSIGEDYYRENWTGARRYVTWVVGPGGLFGG